MADEPTIELVGKYECPACKIIALLARLLEDVDAPELGERFLKPMEDEMKEKGWMRPELNFYARIWMGAVVDEQLKSKIPAGSEVPAYHIYIDACPRCGNLFAAKLETSRGVKASDLAIGKQSGIVIPESFKRAFEGDGPQKAT